VAVRQFGKFTTSIYESDEFRALTFEQQGVYYMLGLQSEISAAGVLPLRFKRWTRNAAGATVSGLRAVLDVLAPLGHIVYDEDTEELLIVKFVKWDKGYMNEKRRPVVDEAARAIMSPVLRETLADELWKISSDLPDTASDTASRVVYAFLSDTASAIAPDVGSRFDRSVVTLGENGNPPPQSSIQEREPFADGEPPSPFCAKHPKGTDKSCGPCGTARRRRLEWDAAAPERKRRAAAERRAAIDACPACDADGWLLTDSGDPSAFHCDHPHSRTRARAS
jgi:hypothetical protein